MTGAGPTVSPPLAGYAIRALLAVAGLALLAAIVISALLVKPAALDEAALAAKCAASAPEWPTYDEDVKGQIGASAVAQWRGEPAEAAPSGGGVIVRFSLGAPWAGVKAALPVLLRLPAGDVLRAARSEFTPDGCTYIFEWPRDSASTLPWIELRYPHTERRIILDAAGRWSTGL